MIRFAQIISTIFVFIFTSAAIACIFFPGSISEASGFNAVSDYGLTNVRTLGAPLLMLAVVTAIGTFRRDWIILVPASLYFLFNGLTRVLSLLQEQYDPIMIRGLILTFVLFSLSLVVIYIFRKSKTNLKQTNQLVSA
ncbi:hypothetical protein [Microbulbifer variabilis]|uniref:hypothetical protein n=1 Tax=Microbulbifer variabilis TaxID=266805 RepID=UPI00035F54B3|nr:hypothetical protein [Microbulbifer variabilis]